MLKVSWILTSVAYKKLLVESTACSLKALKTLSLKWKAISLEKTKTNLFQQSQRPSKIYISSDKDVFKTEIIEGKPIHFLWEKEVGLVWGITLRRVGSIFAQIYVVKVINKNDRNSKGPCGHYFSPSVSHRFLFETWRMEFGLVHEKPLHSSPK